MAVQVHMIRKENMRVSSGRLCVRDSLAEAYELCQKRSSLVVGGNVWLKMTGVTKRTIVDLSGLGLDKIEETGMNSGLDVCAPRQLEHPPGAEPVLWRHFQGMYPSYRGCADA